MAKSALTIAGKRILSVLAALAVVIGLAGCACPVDDAQGAYSPCGPPPPAGTGRFGKSAEVSSSANQPLLSTPISPDAAVLDFIANSHTGQERGFSGTSWGEDIIVVVGDDYYSALGEICRKASIIPAGRNARDVVAVRHEDGSWSMAPDVMAKFMEA